MATGNLPTSQSSIILGCGGVIWLTQSVETVLTRWWEARGRSKHEACWRSGYPGGVLVHHLAGNGKHLVGGHRTQQETHVLAWVEWRVFPVNAEYENRHRWKPQCQFGDEGGTAHTGPVKSNNNKADSLSKLGIFDHYEGFRRVGCSLHVAEMAQQNGSAHVGL